MLQEDSPSTFVSVDLVEAHLVALECMRYLLLKRWKYRSRKARNFLDHLHPDVLPPKLTTPNSKNPKFS